MIRLRLRAPPESCLLLQSWRAQYLRGAPRVFIHGGVAL